MNINVNKVLPVATHNDVMELLDSPYISAKHIQKVTGYCYAKSLEILRSLPHITTPGGAGFRVHRDIFMAYLRNMEANPQPTPPRFMKQRDKPSVRKYVKSGKYAKSAHG